MPPDFARRRSEAAAAAAAAGGEIRAVARLVAEVGEIVWQIGGVGW